MAMKSRGGEESWKSWTSAREQTYYTRSSLSCWNSGPSSRQEREKYCSKWETLQLGRTFGFEEEWRRSVASSSGQQLEVVCAAAVEEEWVATAAVGVSRGRKQQDAEQTEEQVQPGEAGGDEDQGTGT